MQKILRRFIVVCIFGGFFFVLFFFWAVNRPAGDDASPYRFRIERGEGVNIISRKLKQAGLIRNSFVFETYLWWKNLEGKIIAGDYDVSPSLSIRSLTAVLTGGKTVSRERTITILEGWNKKEIAEYLENEGVVQAGDFLAATKDLEGYLFPDTYRIFKEATVDEIVTKMRAEFDRKVTSAMRTDITDKKRTLTDIVIMASILEREVRSLEEMTLVSDIFWRRLAVGMPLQSDATINFITNGKRPQPTLDDLKIDSPYNTYKYRGLPPEPIGNPGFFALQAAIYPKSNDYWYYLTTLDTGVAHFSKTYAEHLQKKAKYLK